MAMKGFVGRMLFKQEEVEKKVNVVSGGVINRVRFIAYLSSS